MRVGGVLVAAEADEAPARIGVALERCRSVLFALARRFRDDPPTVVLTCARGSSDAAAAWLRALLSTRLGWACGSLPPSTASIYRAKLRLRGAAVIFISQSGAGPDLLAAAAMARQGGAYTVGLVNDERSALARAVDTLLPLSVGRERSVAATKSVLASMALGLALTDMIVADGGDGAARLSDHLGACRELDWSAIAPFFRDARSAYLIGRGPGLAVAREVALKLKEVAHLQAEAVSAAELMHGPIALAGPAQAALLLGTDDEALPSMELAALRLRQHGSPVMCAGLRVPWAASLPVLMRDASPAVVLLGHLQAFYSALARVAAERGHDADRPAGLQKITFTV